MILHAIIVDDEEYSRKSLFFLLQENCPNVEVSFIASSVKQARDFLQQNEVDLVFLDIAMPREDGFELLPSLQKKQSMVIFTTAYDQYALKAIKSNAIDYLLKPIDITELIESVNKAQKWAELLLNQRADDKPSVAENSPADIPLPNKSLKISLPHTHGYTVIDTNDIMYVEADSNYCVFHLKTNENIVTSKPLKEFESLLETNGFMRIHKSVILNFNFLKEYSNKNGLQVVLKDNTLLPVSRRRSTEFQEKSKQYFNK